MKNFRSHQQNTKAYKYYRLVSYKTISRFCYMCNTYSKDVSLYQKQLAHILGMLPSTSLFFSVGEHLFARLCVLTRKEKDDLFSVIFQLREEGFFKSFFYASTILSDFGGLNE